MSAWSGTGGAGRGGLVRLSAPISRVWRRAARIIGLGRPKSAIPPLERSAQIAVWLMIGSIVILDIVARIETGGASHTETMLRSLFDEASSGAVALGVVSAIWPALRWVYGWRSSRARRIGMLGVIGITGAIFHVAAFRAVQVGAAAAIPSLGQHGLFEGFAFEIAKDVAFFMLVSLGLFGAPETIRSAIFEAPTPSPPIPAPTGELLDLFDGRTRFRVRGQEVVAVVSAGNYAEVQLSDGRRPLVRATLRSLETTLSAHGIVRVHRSCLVNPSHVTCIQTLPSGDRRLTLRGERTVSVSRRYSASFEALLEAARPVGRAHRPIAA